jgi:hypothetical protein
MPISPSGSAEVNDPGLPIEPAGSTVAASVGGWMGRKSLESARKRELAMSFMRKIRTMPRDDLHALILQHAGEELAQFFLSYATDLMEREPERATENASSLLLIGYLIRCFEDDLDSRTLHSESPLLH